MKVAEYVAKYLRNRGVSRFFGFQGGAITPLIDAMVCEKMEYIQNYHEQASGFAAEAYARITENFSVVVVTNGPGVTNIVSSIANAYLDSTPLVVIAGQVNVADMKNSRDIRQNGFQEVDSISIVKAITKYAVTVKDVSEIKYELDKAISIAQSGRKGSVFIELPLNIIMSDVDENILVGNKEGKGNGIIIESQIKFAVDLINNSKKPVIIAGAGVRLGGAVEELDEFTKKTNIPVVTTLMGGDVVTENNYGKAGLYGETFANLAIRHSDLLLVLGSRLAKRQIGKEIQGYAPQARIIHVDIDENELFHVVDADVKICSDVRAFLKILNKKALKPNTLEWREKLEKWKMKFLNNTCVNAQGLDPVVAVKKISNFTDKETIITADVGQNQLWVAQGWTFKAGQRLLTSGGLGCMGFSLPASIGAQFADESKNVLAFMGDGGFQMNIQELETISLYGLPIKIIVFNNNSLGMIQEMQYKYFSNRLVGTKDGYGVPDIEKLSNAYKIRYVKVKTSDNVDDLQEILNSKESCLIEIELSQSPTRLLIRYDEDNIYQKNEDEL
jgi:Thiamine pyrophosphate-requiring enzymes [acetolactate synthase, pyruvate dehydrogenase (cytochrome), glyoxylate carboligase, phosphonopyruvate decarboxylase]